MAVTSTQRNPTHIYTQVGVFTVSLTVTNSFGSDTYTWNDAITTEMRKLLPASHQEVTVTLAVTVTCLLVRFPFV